MLRVAIVGCGKIADAHAEQIQRIPGAEIAAVCDREELMARQLCDRFAVRRWFSDIAVMLDSIRPEVVHITTPPQSHYELGMQCLRAGCHVYMEKPFTVNAGEARTLIDAAVANGRKMTVGHDYQFTHAKRRMRALIRDGYLGGPPVHMESYHGYELGAESYARALLGDKQHWVRLLPGQLMHNNISHGICSIAEYLTDDHPRVIAHGGSSPFLKKLDEDGIVDEARAILLAEPFTSAYFTFSTQMRPVLHQFRAYGPDNAIIVDHDQQTCITVRGTRYKSYLEKFVAPASLAKQYAANAAHNVKLFLKRDFHMKSGMKYLMESFYRSITEEAPLPISYREVLLTANIMDDIFAQLKSNGCREQPLTRRGALGNA